MPASLAYLAKGRTTWILDSWPVMEWLKRREPTLTKFKAMLIDAQSGRRHLLLSSINLGEIYYNCWNEWGEARAESVRQGLLQLPIQIVHPTYNDVLDAARIKAEFKVSYADAFVAVLAIQQRAAILTGDPDFLKLDRVGLIALEWLGK